MALTTIDKQNMENTLTPFKMEAGDGVMDIKDIDKMAKEQAELGLGFCKEGLKYQDEETGEIKLLKRANHAGKGYKFTMKEKALRDHYLEECYRRHPTMCKEMLKIIVEDYIKNPDAVDEMARKDEAFMKDIQEDED